MTLFLSGQAAIRQLGALFLALALVLGAGRGDADAPPGFTLHLPGGDSRQLSRADLAAMPLTEFATSTVWTEGTDRYSGVLLRDLLRLHDIDPANGPGRVHLVAIDGYSATIEFDMITDRAPMLAFLRNGLPMPLRRQGPFWLIFPYDDDPSFRTESIYAMSVWQVQNVSITQP